MATIPVYNNYYISDDDFINKVKKCYNNKQKKSLKNHYNNLKKWTEIKMALEYNEITNEEIEK